MGFWGLGFGVQGFLTGFIGFYGVIKFRISERALCDLVLGVQGVGFRVCPVRFQVMGGENYCHTHTTTVQATDESLACLDPPSTLY